MYKQKQYRQHLNDEYFKHKTYKIFDTQCNRYLHDNGTFKTLRECCEALINYHSVDVNMKAEKRLLKQNKVIECWTELSFYEWQITHNNGKMVQDINKINIG